MLRDTVYEVARPTGVCAATGRVIAPGEAFVAVLVEREGEDRLERRDFTAAAWNCGAPARSAGRVVASWRVIMAHREDRGRRLIDDEALAELFEHVIDPEEGESAARGAFRYLLALLLIRRRILRHAGTSPGALLVRWVRDGERARTFEIADPGMNEATISAATERLSDVILGCDAGPAHAPSAEP